MDVKVMQCCGDWYDCSGHTAPAALPRMHAALSKQDYRPSPSSSSACSRSRPASRYEYLNTVKKMWCSCAYRLVYTLTSSLPRYEYCTRIYRYITGRILQILQYNRSIYLYVLGIYRSHTCTVPVLGRYGTYGGRVRNDRQPHCNK